MAQEPRVAAKSCFREASHGGHCGLEEDPNVSQVSDPGGWRSRARCGQLLATAPAEAAGKTICVSWKVFQEERWKTDEAAIKAVVEAAGNKFASADAQNSAAKQQADIEGLITQGCNVILVVAFDSDAILPAFQAAADAGVKMISYDVLVEHPDALYVTFDNVGVGRLMAKTMLEKGKPRATSPSSRATRATRTPPSCSRA